MDIDTEQVRWQAAVFNVPGQNFEAFKRERGHGMDCVTNALQALKLIDSRCAELVRVIHPNLGVDYNAIEDIFRFLRPDFMWSYLRVPVEAVDMSVDALRPMTSLFLGAKWTGQRGYHTFLIAKNAYGQVVMIDPQIGQAVGNTINCNEYPYRCAEVRENVEQFFILAKNETVDPIVNISVRITPPSR